MKKIKKFKVNLRKREIIRNLKAIGEIKQLTPEIEALIITEMNRLPGIFAPASIFETLPVEEIKEKFMPLIFPGDRKIVAVSIAAVTIGEAIESEIDAIFNRGEHIHTKVLRAAGLEGCDSGLKVIHRIIRQEASADNCEILPVEHPPKGLFNSIIETLSAGKIGVSADEGGMLHPVFSSIGVFKWQSRRR